VPQFKVSHGPGDLTGAADGSQYRSAIFYHNEKQKRFAEETKQELTDSKRFNTVYTEITEASKFFPAEV
jgi:peptide methionine sulfoxide reductase MsrA